MLKIIPSISVVIVTWNSQNEISACLRSVSSSLVGLRSEVIVIDNNSLDNTCQRIKQQFPTVRLIKLKKNIGFGGGNNIGLSLVRYERVMLLNPDTRVNPDAIKTMWTFLEAHPQVGAVGPDQVNEKGLSIFTMSKLSPRGIGQHLLEYACYLITKRPVILFRQPYRVSMLNAGCIMARTNLFPTRKWFNPKLFIYGEEPDLFHRTGRIGWQIYFLRNCSIVHFRERSIRQTSKKILFGLKSFSYLLIQRFTEKTTPRGFFWQ